MINTVNRYKHKSTPADYTISRPSPLGNPFTHITNGKTLAKFMVASRDEACDSYEKYLREKIAAGDTEVLKALRKIKLIEKEFGYVNLVCFCAPQRCHGHSIEKILTEITF